MSEPDKTPPEALQSAQDGAPARPDGKPLRKPGKKRGPPKGVRIGGKQKGSKNKRTLEREEKARAELERLRAMETASHAAIAAEVEKATGKPPVSGKDVLIQLVSVYMGLTALYQPWAQWNIVGGKRTNSNPNYNEDMFRHYSAMAKETAAVLTPFQHPRYSAMVVGASVVTKVEIDGGFPSDFKAPVGLGTVLPALTVISAEDDDVELPIPKAVGE